MRAITSILAVCAAAAATSSSSTDDPRVQVKNGTYIGVRNPTYKQDYFLGMPYAQQPVGNLRFTIPQSLNETWTEERNAKEVSNICVGYGVRASILHGGFDPVQTCLDMLTLADGLDLVPDVRGLSYVERIPRLIGGRESQAARWRMDSRRRVLAGFRHRPAI